MKRILNSTVNPSTGFAPSVMLFGRNVDLNRGIMGGEVLQQKVIECPKYVQDLLQMQEQVLKVAEEKVSQHFDVKIAKKKEKKGVNLRSFVAGDLVVTLRDDRSKLDYKWRGPYRVLKKAFANVYEIEDLRTQKKLFRDVSVLRSFTCADGVDPMSVAGQDEGEYVVESIIGHRLEGNKKQNKTHWYYKVKFKDGTEDWLPYFEVRDLEAFNEYLKDHRDFAKKLKMKVFV